jgi:hypothetical protein
VKLWGPGLDTRSVLSAIPKGKIAYFCKALSMNNSVYAKSAFHILAVVYMAIILVGCQQGAPTETPSTPAVAGTFTGQDLAESIEELEGTPLYSISQEITDVAKVEGAAFLLIAPQDPTKALLVVEVQTTPADLAKRDSKQTKYSGKRKTMDSQALVDLVRERYELELQTDDQGKVVVLQTGPQPTPATQVEEGAQVDQK